eukprot:scaffold278602_cov19-Tisochrysis_lutea.AAC.1
MQQWGALGVDDETQRCDLAVWVLELIARTHDDIEGVGQLGDPCSKGLHMHASICKHASIQQEQFPAIAS